MKIFSKSVYVLLFTDMLIFLFSSLFLYQKISLPDEYKWLTVAGLTLIGLYVLFLKGYYKIRTYNFFLKDSYLLIEGLVLSAMPVCIMLLMFHVQNRTVFKFLLSETALVFLLISLFRTLFYWHRKHIKPDTNVLIIGAGEIGKLMADEILKRPVLKFNLKGFVDNDANKANLVYRGINVLGKTADLHKIIPEYNIKIIIVAIRHEPDYQTLMDISECVPQGVSIWKMPSFYEKIAFKIPVQSITPDWFMYNFTSTQRPVYDVLKRIYDIIAASIILTVTMPVLLIIAIGVKLHDGGPIIYTQPRIGKGGKPFKLYKIRTMCMNADKAGMVDKGNTEDERVIPFCKWVRKVRFDEIPQMINILKGEMSIVGPRAEFEDFVRKYEKEIPFYNRRHWIKPGWTGWAQINQGHCVQVDDITEKLRYDFYYIKKRNIFWEISILLKAVGLALSGRHS